MPNVTIRQFNQKILVLNWKPNDILNRFCFSLTLIPIPFTSLRKFIASMVSSKSPLRKIHNEYVLKGKLTNPTASHNAVVLFLEKVVEASDICGECWQIANKNGETK